MTNLEELLLAECSDLAFAQNIVYHAMSMADKYENYKINQHKKHTPQPAAAASADDTVSHITAPTLALATNNMPMSAESLQGKVLAAWIRSGGDIRKIYNSRDVIQKLVRWHGKSCRTWCEAMD